jgi:hypothetical protein
VQTFLKRNLDRLARGSAAGDIGQAHTLRDRRAAAKKAL